MAYQDQQVKAENIEDRQAELAADLKAYQEKATALATERFEQEQKIEELRRSITILTQEVAVVQNELAALESRKTQLTDEVDTIFKDKVVELDKYRRNVETELIEKTKGIDQKADELKKEKDALMAEVDRQRHDRSVLENREKELSVFEEHLQEWAEKLEARETAVTQAQQSLEIERATLNAQAHNLAAEVDACATQQKENAEIRQRINSELAKWTELNAALTKQLEGLKSVETARAQFTQDLIEFGDAKTKLELREAALMALEQQLKKWEQDLKQQEAVLIAQAKGE